MQRFAFLLLVASVVLLGAVIPVQAAFLRKRKANLQRLAPERSPISPLRASLSKPARRTTNSTGRLQVQSIIDDGLTLGYVFNDPFLNVTGLNLFSVPIPANPDVVVVFTGTSLSVPDPLFLTPFFVGGLGKSILTPQTLNTIEFNNVDEPDGQGWNLNITSGQLNLTWSNPDGSIVQPTLMYDTVTNALNFTENPDGLAALDPSQTPCNIFLTP